MTEPLNDSCFNILRCVYRNIALSSAQASEALGLSVRTCSNVLRQLRQQGLVSRKKHIEDVRRWFYYITEPGQTVYINESIRRGVLGCP
ncbi:MAG: MarR family transcriptional regulator [Planctomycetota bacterium]|jgi:DNA-binding MarR family transcriptional regulator